MPRALIGVGYRFQRIELGSLQPGDLLFFKAYPLALTNGVERSIVHMAIAVGPNLIAHSSSLRKGPCVEDLSRKGDDYVEKLRRSLIDEADLLLRYIDPRNRGLRLSLSNGMLPFPVPKPLPSVQGAGGRGKGLDAIRSRTAPSSMSPSVPSIARSHGHRVVE